MRILRLLIILFISQNIFSQQTYKIAVISDTHYLSSKLVYPSTSLKQYENSTGRNVKDLHAVFDKVTDELIQNDFNILLIPGDLTNNGERDSHLDLAERLKGLRNKGIQTFVIPGNHDINVPNAKKYLTDTPTATNTISANEFAEIYSSFGYAQAISRDSTSLSYLTSINPNTWLLCFDSNRYAENKTSTITAGRISPNTLQWVINILKEAKSKNIKVIGMMHHGIVEHMPYQSTFFSQYLIDNWKETAELLADNGLRVIFTGHFHSNDVTLLTTSKGNEIYDVETGSLAGYPFPYRLMELEGKKLTIRTKFVKEVSHNSNLQEEYKLKTEKMIKRIASYKIDAMSLPIPADAKKAVIDLLVEMQLQHMKGDEKVDADMLQRIEQLKKMIGDTSADVSSFQLDFPPSDNNLEIIL